MVVLTFLNCFPVFFMPSFQRAFKNFKKRAKRIKCKQKMPRKPHFGKKKLLEVAFTWNYGKYINSNPFDFSYPTFTGYASHTPSKGSLHQEGRQALTMVPLGPVTTE